MNIKMNPIPDGFARVAPSLTLAQASSRWYVSQRTISRWEDATGVYCKRRGNPKASGRKGYTAGTTEKRRNEEIDICLNCTREVCRGYCHRFRK